MNIFPGIPEVILAIFAALLSLAVSLSLLKIQTTITKSVKKLEEEQKILIAKQSETEEFIRSKLVTSQETQDALDFIEKEATTVLDKISDDLTILENKMKRITLMTAFSVFLMALTIGLNGYLSFVFFKSGGRVNLSELIAVTFLNIFSLIYFWYEGRLLKKFINDFSVIKDRFVYLSNEIIRAIDLAAKSIK